MDDNRKLWSVILILADEVIRICDKYDIPYFIYAGTLLGAVRHKGFIPWDDDFDFAMKRTDYERFLKACEKELDKEKFFMQDSVTDNYYSLGFGKLRLNGTVFKERFSENADIHHGIFVDIFPMDNIPDKPIERKIHIFTHHIIKNMMWIKCGFGTKRQKTQLSYKAGKILGSMFTLDFLKKARYSLCVKYNGIETKECFNSEYLSDIVENRFFDEAALYEFEGRMMKGFKDAHGYLKTKFGDYMQLPPEDKRMTHNCGVEYGKY